MAGRLSVAGQGEHAVRIGDLSEGGACLHDAPAMPPGTRSVLRIDGVAAVLPCVARSTDAAGLHLAFELDAAAMAAFRPIFAQLVARRAA